MTVSSQIIEVLDNLCAKLGVAIDWSQETVLPYIQELYSKYISWEIATSIAWIIFAVVACEISATVLITLDVKRWEEGWGSAFGAILVVCGIILIFVQAFDILKCVYFPELQAFEYISNLIRTRT